MWQDHAEFSVRTGNLNAALASARAVLEVAPTHCPALLLLSATSLTMHLRQQQTGSEEQDRQLLDTACVAAHALVQASGPECGQPWAMLALVYCNGGYLRGREVGWKGGGVHYALD